MILQRAVDKAIYEEELAPWLPDRVIDCHVHVRLAEHMGPISPERKKMFWALEAAGYQTWEDLEQTYETLFPRQDVSFLAFGSVFREMRIEENNEYVLQGVSRRHGRARGLIVTRPEWSSEVIEEAISRGFSGIKPYPDLAMQPTQEVSIYDFVPRRQLAALDRLGGVLMLHLPRAGRIAHPDNIRELLQISQDFPSIKMIVAHIGRAYCLETAMKGLPYFADRTGVYFDTAANLNANVFQYALETVGPDRLLYGSDLPIMMMRGVREHVGDRYINYTDGPYSWNTNRKSPEEEADYTYYLYEELRALIKAVERSGFGRDVFQKIMYSNSAGLLSLAAGCPAAAREWTIRYS